MTGDSVGSASGDVSRRLVLASAAGAASTLLLPSGTAQARGGRQRTFRYSDHEPLGGMRTSFLKDVLFPGIERESNGRLRIEDHWNGEIAGSFDALSAVTNGSVTDMATVVPEYTPAQLPLHQIFKSFPLGPTGSGQIEFFRRVYADVPALTAELDKNNLVQIFLGTGYPAAFFSPAPLPSLDSLHGGTWRSSSFWHKSFLANAGATPATTPWGSATIEALETGALDGVFVNVDDAYSIGVQEPAPHVLISETLWLGHLYPIAINKDVWNGLPRHDKHAVRRAVEKSYRALGPVMGSSFDTQVDELTQAGAEVRILPRDELMRWRSITEYREVQAAWAEKQMAAGVTGAAATIAQVARTMRCFMPSLPE